MSQPTLLQVNEARLTGASSKGGKCVESPPTLICGKRRKNRRKPVIKNIPDLGVVFTFEEGINTSHVCPKGQQPIFLELWKLYYLNFYFFLFFEVDKSGALTPTYPPLKRKSDLRSSFLRVNHTISFYLKGDHLKALDL